MFFEDRFAEVQLSKRVEENVFFFADELRTQVEDDAEEMTIVRKFIADPAPKKFQLYWEIDDGQNVVRLLNFCTLFDFSLGGHP